MNASEIRSKIRRREDAINNERKQIKKLDDQINDLKALSGRLSKLQSAIEGVQNDRKKRLSNICNCTINTVITARYYDGMEQELRSRQYQDAIDGFDDARHTIVIALRDYNAEIAECERKIKSYEREINNLKNQLKNVQLSGSW